MSNIEIAGQTDVGLRRKDNQDTFICQLLDSSKWALKNTALLAAIDGVGGYAGGDKAAAIAKEYMEAYMGEPRGDIPTMLREAVVNANNQIYDERKQDLRLSQMCCVLTVAIADADKQRLHFVHVGDTRLYRFRQGALVKLSNDHSLVGVREDAGELSEEEAMNHPRRNEILRDVGSERHQIDDLDFFEVGETDFRPDDLVLLCSDGLSDMLTRAQMTAVLNKKNPLATKVEELIQLANQQGGKDNITVVLAQNKSRSARPITPHSGRKQEYAPVTATNELLPSLPESDTSSDIPVDPIPEPEKRKTNLPRWIAGGVLAVALLIGGFWFWWSRAPNPQPPTIAQAATKASLTTKKARISLDSLLRMPHKNQLVVSADSLGDTLRLAQPIVLSDSLDLVVIGSPLVIVPVDTSQKHPAFQLTKGSRIRLECVVIQDFAIGIQAEENARLQLKDVYFKNVGKRLVAELPASDSLTNQDIIFSVKPLLLLKPKLNKP